MEGVVAAPLYALTDRDHSAIIVLVTIVSSLVSFAALAIKIALTRHIPTRYFFDYILLAAVSCLFIETILITYAAHIGLGRYEESLDRTTVEQINQVFYISIHPILILSTF